MPTAFEDPVTLRVLSRIYLRCGSRLDGIQCEYDDGLTTPWHGGQGGTAQIFVLDLTKGEAIVSMTIWSGLDVDAIQFVTSLGRVSPKYGGSGGSPGIWRGNLGNKARALMGWKGTSDTLVRYLEPVWSDTQDLSGTHVVVGESKGGNGGTAFDMLDTAGDPLTTRLSSITVHSGSGIDAIECTFQVGNKTVSSGKKGGNGGSAHTFELRFEEQITRIEGRANTGLCKLQFFTNQGRSSDVYGSNTAGDPFIWLPPSYDPNNPGAEVTGLICFEGASGKMVDRLAPVWAANPPLSYQLIIDDFDESQLQQNGKVEAAWAAEKVTDNFTNDPLKSTFSWSMSAEKTSTITFSQSTRSLIGGKVSVEVIARGKVGIPFVGEGEVETKIAVEVSGEKEWGSEVTDEKTVSRSYTETHSDEVIVRPMCQGQGKAIGYRMECADLQWKGKMVIIYSDGSTRTVQPVSGTLTSSSMTTIHATYKSVPLSDLK
ncbi:hypothetical protein D9758_014901 [Tetrapyrgos nigripes]|uniref:Jacalin-type lectin domain-containing protein n=1 Tax=Tetrapyrgos nigripes TaxID=182062 RepID=A0A8H5CF91_9AGAR|nr:hypothetical protein D9758_014901 [Tetrapyrgos nigripes]